MNAVLSLAVILIVSCVAAVMFFLMAVGGKEIPTEKHTEEGEIDPTDYSEMEEEYYR